MVKRSHNKISLRRQCELLGIARSGYYRKMVPMSEENLEIMEKIDEQYMKTPYYGSPKMTVYLRVKGYEVNVKRIKRLMRVMGISGVQIKPKTSAKEEAHYIYPYLLRHLEIDRVNMVWCSDITYLRVRGGFMYLVAVMDWHSRYVLSWELSNSLDRWFCVDALNSALAYAKPEIFNTDQGSQFTSKEFTGVLKQKGVRISMDGKGRCMDNIMIERLWRSLKYEDIYLKHYQTVDELYDGLTRYFYTYNHERPHQSLGYETPANIYFKDQKKREVILC